jgi:hypothetical protein
MDNSIRKAIIIQPIFELGGVNSSLWNLLNVAWTMNKTTFQKKRWIKELVIRKPFDEIESNIHQLLRQSEQNLNAIEMKDLY